MNLGMMWLDKNPKTTLDEKVKEAAAYYAKKYGRQPDLCFANPSMIPTSVTRVGDIDIRPNRSVLPNHLWLGFRD